MYAESTQVLLSTLQSLRTTSQYSDLIIFCGTESHRVHKAIICPRSSFFAGACRFGKEASRNEVTLEEDEPEIVGLMIDYLYQLDYKISESAQVEVCEPSQSGEQAYDSALPPVSPVAQTIEMFEDISGHPNIAEDFDKGLRLSKKGKKGKKKGRVSPLWDEPPESVALMDAKTENRELLVHAQVYSIAEKYDIPDLKEVAKDKFAARALENWDDAELLHAAEIVYMSTVETDTGLRKVVVETLRRHRELLEKSEVQKCVKEVPGLAFDLLKCVWSE